MSREGLEKKLKNFSRKIWSVQNFFVTLQSFSALPNRSTPSENIERFTIDIKSSTRAKCGGEFRRGKFLSQFLKTRVRDDQKSSSFQSEKKEKQYKQRRV